MIDCPACGHPNIEGADNCEACQADLFDLGLPESTADGLGQRLLTDSIMELEPQLQTTVSPETPLRQVVQTMCDEKLSAVMAVHRGSLVGVFTERDFLMRAADRYDELCDRPIREFMTADPESLEAKDSIAFGLNRMAVKSYRHLPLLEDGKPIAMVRIRDVLKYIAKHCPEVG